jgi:hypothetical protein
MPFSEYKQANITDDDLPQFNSGKKSSNLAPRMSFMNSKRFNNFKRTRQQDEGLNIVEDE